MAKSSALRKNKLFKSSMGPSAFEQVDQSWENKGRVFWGGTPTTEMAEPLVSDSANVIQLDLSKSRPASLNEIPNMTALDIQEVYSLIERRYQQARPQTQSVADEQARAEKQYEGEWQNVENTEQDHIYLGKSREMVQVVSAFIQQMLIQLPVLIQFQPTPSTLIAAREDWERAKVKEALINYQMDDVWKIRTDNDLLPGWIKSFLKFPTAVWGVFFTMTDEGPDLKILNVDRSQIYADPYSHDLEDSGWIIYTEYMQRSEIIDNFENGTWQAPPWLNWYVRGLGLTQPNANFFERYFGLPFQGTTNIREDDLVEIWHYYQPAIKGKSHRYAVVVGGLGGALVWYGPNPFPFKGIPFTGRSYDPHEYKNDGSGLLKLYRPMQEIINTLLNLRLDDVRQNIHDPVFLTEDLVDATTQQDMEDRQKLVRLSKDAIQALKMQDTNFDLRRYMQGGFIKPSTGELWGDIGQLLNQGKDLINVGDVLRGQMASKEATLGEVQQSLLQNIGVFRPVMTQIMSGLEHVASIVDAYYQDEDFFGPERLITILGTNNRYADVIKRTWYQPIPGVHVTSAKPEDMHVPVKINAVDGMQQQMTRMTRLAALQQVLAAIGQVPDLFSELRDNYDWGKLMLDILMQGPEDMESIQRTPQEIKQRQEARQQAQEMQQQNQLTFQTQLMALMEKAKYGEKAKSEIAVDTNKAALDGRAQTEAGTQALEQIVAKGSVDRQNKMIEMMLEGQQDIRRMVHELVAIKAEAALKPPPVKPASPAKG